MVRNNPMSLTDPYGNSPISINHDVKRGDLLYGLTYERNNYMDEIRNNAHDMFIYKKYYAFGKRWTLKDEFGAIFIDDYNYASYYMLENLKSSSGGNIVDIGKENVHKTLQNQPFKGFPLWDSYFKERDKGHKFNMLMNYEKSISGNKIFDRPYVKGGSKLGIEIVIENLSNKNTKIHFILDNINMEHVVNKTGGKELGDSVTASELRYAYRNRERLKDNIIFYRNYNEVAPPWKENPSLWLNYVPKSEASTSKVTTRVRRQNMYSVSRT